MEIKGFGSYTSVEKHLATLTSDEQNELYFSGKLDCMLDDAENVSKVKRYSIRNSLNKSLANGGEEE